jgi:hypothetical protein
MTDKLKLTTSVYIVYYDVLASWFVIYDHHPVFTYSRDGVIANIIVMCLHRINE